MIGVIALLKIHADVQNVMVEPLLALILTIKTLISKNSLLIYMKEPGKLSALVEFIHWLLCIFQRENEFTISHSACKFSSVFHSYLTSHLSIQLPELDTKILVQSLGKSHVMKVLFNSISGVTEFEFH